MKRRRIFFLKKTKLHSPFILFLILILLILGNPIRDIPNPHPELSGKEEPADE